MTKRARVIRWVRDWGGSDVIVWVNVAKLNHGWLHAEPDDYIRARGLNSRGKYFDFGAWLAANEKRRFRMAHVAPYRDGVSFTNGRHRFAWMRDHGVKYLPVTTYSRKDAGFLRRAFGTRARISWMTSS